MSSSFNANDGEISLRDLHNVVMELLTRFNQVFPPPQQNNNAQGQNIVHDMMITPSPLNRTISSSIPGAVVTRNRRGQDIVTDKNKLLNFIRHVYRSRNETISPGDAERKYKNLKKLALATQTWMIGAMEGSGIPDPEGISWKNIGNGIKTRAYAVLEAKARVENCGLENAMDSWAAELFLADACHTRYNQYRDSQGLSGGSRRNREENTEEVIEAPATILDNNGDTIANFGNYSIGQARPWSEMNGGV